MNKTMKLPVTLYRDEDGWCGAGVAGWNVARQKGSHVVLVKPGSMYSLSIPLHDELGPGLLRDQIRKAGLTVDEFIVLLRS
jgi:predicted RNA binding protein YcfA (HicA-like mRNA interferase family)